jgi:hypothetical protein
MPMPSGTAMALPSDVRLWRCSILESPNAVSLSQSISGHGGRTPGWSRCAHTRLPLVHEPPSSTHMTSFAVGVHVKGYRTVDESTQQQKSAPNRRVAHGCEPRSDRLAAVVSARGAVAGLRKPLMGTWSICRVDGPPKLSDSSRRPPVTISVSAGGSHAFD